MQQEALSIDDLDFDWFVWGVEVRDPQQLAENGVGERTGPAVAALAAERGCRFEYCVDDDSYDLEPAGTYYRWLVRVSSAEHHRRGGDGIPSLVGEIWRTLRGMLPEDLTDWSVRLDLSLTMDTAASGLMRATYADLLEPLEDALHNLRRNGAQDLEPLAKVWTNHGGPVLAATYHMLMDVQDPRPGSPWLVLDAGIAPPDGFRATDAGRRLTMFGVAPDAPVLIHPRPRPVLWAAEMTTSHFPSSSPNAIQSGAPTAAGAKYRWTSPDVEGLVRILSRDLRVLLAARRRRPR
jgi:hypothetical protein